MAAGESQPNHRVLLIVAAVLTVAAWQFPLGRQLLYPFTLLATYAHEMGHGLTALLLGASFDALEMHADGSGLAHWTGDVGRLARGLIAAGGLVGPSIAGATLLVLTRSLSDGSTARRGIFRAPILLFLMGGLIALSVLIFARSLFAVAFLGTVAAVLIAVGRFLPGAAPFLVRLAGVQLCLSVFRDLDYMFSDRAMVDGVLRISDSAALADALLLPYWFWGAVTAAFSFAVLGAGLYLSLRRRPA